MAQLFAALLFFLLATAALALRIHLLTIPAHGHYMTLRDVGVALKKRGHDVTFALCEGNRKLFVKDGLKDLGIRFLSAGNCSLYYEGYDPAMRALLEKEDLNTVGAVLDGVAGLSRQMCEEIFPVYAAASRMAIESEDQNQRKRETLLPDVIVFDADTFCAQDLSIAFRIPRVARVGTGPRDTYQNPVSVPQYGTALPLKMTTLQRFKNALSLFFSRWLIGPMILQRLAARDRFSPRYAALASSEPDLQSFVRAMQALAGGESPSEKRLSVSRLEEKDADIVKPVTTEGESFHLDRFNAEIPWDGAPVLYNSHWGLEHARPLHPHEAMIGHTTDFVKEESRSIDAYLQRWLLLQQTQQGTDPAPVPVVYVGMGTLSILPERTLRALYEAMKQSTVARFLWVVAENQQTLLPEHLRTYAQRWRQEGAAENATEVAPAVSAAAGDILLVSWVPQVAVLKHSAVKVFWSHGGMNGVAEGTYSRSPFLCTPLFSDQPDNCQHIHDRGMGLRLNTDEVTPEAVEAALKKLLTRRDHFVRGLEAAWRANVAAGGISRAVQIIESTAALGYEGSRSAFVPRALQRAETNDVEAADGGTSSFVATFKPKNQLRYLIEKYDIDVIAGAAMLLWLLLLLMRRCFACCCSCRCCRCCCRAGKTLNKFGKED